MKKLTYVLAALASIAIAVPTIASAEGFGVNVSGDREHGDRDRGEMRRGHDRASMHVEMRGGDRDHGRNWRHSRAEQVVVIKHRRHHHED